MTHLCLWVFMITKRLQGSLNIWGGPLLLSAVSGLLLLAPSTWAAALSYQRQAVTDGQWWRLLTDNFVHLGFWHWLFNALSLVLWGFLCPQPLTATDWSLRLLLIGIGMSLGLYWFTPQLETYVGLSGVIYGLFLLDLSAYALAGDGIAWACIVFLLCRVGWEWGVGIPAAEERLLGGQVV
ncbi:MAG: rhombosortase, partial [Gammaproteobacteria bacterium]|nr:rhombosortase [Gammaproteobacteria bacterium]